jgi:intracellular sulfur oxidation DsrE/DsrF family protein
MDRLPEVKIVWDVTLGNEALYEDRLGLIQQTADVIRRKGMTPNFAIVMHGPATKFAARSLKGTKFENEEIERLSIIQSIMSRMSEENVRFIQCQVPMCRNGISEDNVLPFIDISETIFFDLAMLQKEGYAYIPIMEM